MYYIKSIVVLFVFAILLSACQQNPSTNIAPVLTSSTFKLSTEDCVKDSTCAKVSIEYPVFVGSVNPEILKSINDAIAKEAVMSFDEGTPTTPIPAAFDTMAKQLFAMLKSDGSTIPGMSYYYESKGQSVFMSPKFLSVESISAYFTGGAHGMYGTKLQTYDLHTGKVVSLTDVVKDTVALLPLLESAFVASKKEEGADSKLEDMLYTDNKHLPMTNNFCITKEGIRVNYLPYEVAAYAFGETDILITWEQLGKLADSKKWIE